MEKLRRIVSLLVLMLSTGTSFQVTTANKHPNVYVNTNTRLPASTMAPFSSHHNSNHSWQQTWFPQQQKEQQKVINTYQRRKDEWANQYTSVDALCKTFGHNRNPFWGDLDAGTARRLYKTLLPKALLELYKMGVQPQDLAPLAYRARVAAKLYARYRCEVPARVAANLYDGFRQWRKYGSFNTNGMSYQQLWEKYSTAILDECQGEEDLEEEDVTARICLKILEKSCSTNDLIDKLVLSDEESEEERQDLHYVIEKLEHDVRNLLEPVEQVAPQLSAQKFKTLRALARIKQRLEGKPSRLPTRNHHLASQHNRVRIWENRDLPTRRP